MKKKQVPVTSKFEGREAEQFSALGVDDKKRTSDQQQSSGNDGKVQTLQKKKSFFGSVNLKKKVKHFASQIMKGKPSSPTTFPTPPTEFHPPLPSSQLKSQQMSRPPLNKISHTFQNTIPWANKPIANQVYPPKKPRKTASWPPPKIFFDRRPVIKQSNNLHRPPSSVYIENLRKAIKMDSGHMLNVPSLRAATNTRPNSYGTLQRQLARLQLCDEALTNRAQRCSQEKICADKGETNEPKNNIKPSLSKQYPCVSFVPEKDQSLPAISLFSSDGNPSGLSTPSLTNESSQASIFELKRVSSLPTTIQSEKSNNNDVLVEISTQIFNRSPNSSISDFQQHFQESKHHIKKRSEKRKDTARETSANRSACSYQSQKPRQHHPNTSYTKKVSKDTLNVGPVYPNQRRRPNEVGRAKTLRGPVTTPSQIPDFESMLSIYAHF
ncbi:hypothetical protein C365_04851 [Cryptococcus neoformans Bt85]|nr:hypothetical protein C365_04851 [Cryptococcus neoformans var. grubii Bt85]